MSTEATKKSTDSDQQQEPQNKSSFSMIIRVLLVLGLVYFTVKPYLDKPREDDSARQTFKIVGKTMGTKWHAAIVSSSARLVKLNYESDSGKNKQLLDQPEDEIIDSCEALLSRIVQRELDKIDASASTYRADSEVSRFNRSKSTDWFPVSEDLAKMVSIAQDVSAKTDGAFDITVAPLVDLYRFGPNKSALVSFPTDEEINALRSRVGYDKLQVRFEPEPALKKTVPDLSIDLSSIAKGYAVDVVADALEKEEIEDYLIDVGGEIRCRGKKFDSHTGEVKDWTLGVQRPEVVSSEIAARYIPDMYRYLYFGSEEKSSVLATSGDYNNHLQIGNLRISHLVDPRSGRPTEMVDVNDEPENILGSVSVVSTDGNELSCAQSDAFATAFSVLGVEEGLPLADELGIAVLFLSRYDDSASTLEEHMSKTFKASVRTDIANEPMPEPETQTNPDEARR
jgi:thiamine biosynthesis lipoprotein